MASTKKNVKLNPGLMNCLHCSKTIEIINDDPQFSIDLHMQSHVPLELTTQNVQRQNLSFQLSEKERTHGKYACPDCGQNVQIYNNDLKLSLQLHVEKHPHITHKTKTKSEDSFSASSSGKSKTSNKKQINMTVSSLEAIGQSESILENVFNNFQPGLKAHRGFIIENEERKVYCSICSLETIHLSKISEHLKTKSHEDKTICFLKEKLPSDLEGIMEFVSFYGSNLCCNLCRCKIDLCSYSSHETIVNIVAHNAKKCHVEKNTNLKTLQNCEEAFEILKFFSDICPLVQENKHLIDFKMQPEFKCKLCDKQIIYNNDENVMLKNFTSHLRSKLHIKCVNADAVLTSFMAAYSSSITQHILTVSKERGSIFCTSCECHVEADVKSLTEHVKKTFVNNKEQSPSTLLNKDLNIESTCFNNPINKNQLWTPDIFAQQSMHDSPSCSTFESNISNQFMKLKDILILLPETEIKVSQISRHLIENKDGKVTCTLCKCVFHCTADNVLRHLKEKSHTVIFKIKSEEAFDRKDDKLKALLSMLPDFQNHGKNLSQNHKGEIECLVCVCKIPATTHDVQIHLEGFSHKENETHLEMKQVNQETLNANRTILNLNALLTSMPPPFRNVTYVVESSPGQVTCLICNCIIPATTYNLKLHLTSKKHTKNEQGMTTVGTIDKLAQSNSVSNYLSDNDTHCANSNIDLLTVEGSPNTTCQQQLIYNNNFLKHLKKTNPLLKSALKHFDLKGNDRYFCKVCDYNTESFRYDDEKTVSANIISHFQSQTHMKAVSEKKYEVVKELLLSTDAVVQANRHYLHWQEENLVCTLCKGTKPLSVTFNLMCTQNNVVVHCTDKKHLNNLEQFETPLSFAELEDSNINNPIKNLPTPVLCESLNEIPFIKDSPANNNLNDLLKSLPKPFRNITYLLESSPGHITCLICNCVIPATSYNLSTHLTGNNHTKNEQGMSKTDDLKKSSSGIQSVEHNPFLVTNKDPSVGNPCSTHQEKTKNNNYDLLNKLKKTDVFINKVSKYLVIKNSEYFCNACNYLIHTSNDEQIFKDNIMSHFKDQIHKTGLSEKQDDVVQQLFQTTFTVIQSNSCYLKRQGGNLVCTLCNQSMSISLDLTSMLNNIIPHLNGKTHKTKVENSKKMSPSLSKSCDSDSEDSIETLFKSLPAKFQEDYVYMDVGPINGYLKCTLCCSVINPHYLKQHLEEEKHIQGKHVNKSSNLSQTSNGTNNMSTLNSLLGNIEKKLFWPTRQK